MTADLDPRWDWIECPELGGTVTGLPRGVAAERVGLTRSQLLNHNEAIFRVPENR